VTISRFKELRLSNSVSGQGFWSQFLVSVS
jgi:hypothetical protein